MKIDIGKTKEYYNSLSSDMLMTVLRGEIAVKQSKALIRMFSRCCLHKNI